MKALEILREKSLSQVALNLSYFNDCKTAFAISECKSWIDKIFDEVEKELEEDMKSKSCEGCRHIHQGWWCNENGIKVNLDFCCNRYEPKDNL